MTEQTYNRITVVDEEDNVIGAEQMFDAIEKGLIRRGTRVFLFNSAGQVLVQQRSAHIHRPHLLDQSASGHVDEGETYHSAAVQELREELGLENVPLVEIATSYRTYTEKFFNGIYKAVLPDDMEIQFDSHEVAKVHWFTPDELSALMAAEPERFSNSFIEVWEAFRDKLIAA